MEKHIKIGDKIYPVTSDDNYLTAMGNTFEPHMVQLFRSLITSNDVVADIGANIGLTAILFSSLAKHTYAFEPSPSTFRILSENLTRNRIANVEAINLGLGHKKEALTITFAQNNRSGGYVSDKIRPETGHVTEEIHIDTLDHFFSASAPEPTVLKIDVEGFEWNVLKGGGRFLQRVRPVVVLEMNHFCLDVLQRITIPDFLDFMRGIFPHLYAVDTDNKTIVDLHVPDSAYMVMHEHVVKHRFPNLVGGFDPTLKAKLDTLVHAASQAHVAYERVANRLRRVADKLTNAFKIPALAKPAGALTALCELKQIKAGDTIDIPVRVSNQSQDVWHGDGEHPVLLSYHWNNSDGGEQIYDGVRTALYDIELAPGKNLEQHMTVIAPNETGRFKLILTLVQEGVCWFEDRRFGCATLDIWVV